MRDWTVERCAEQPEELQEISSNTYMQRRNIAERQAEETEGMPTHTEWVCESREISIDDYNMLKSIQEINTQGAIDEYTQQLVEGGIL